MQDEQSKHLMVKPVSSRVKLIVEYDEKQKKFIMSNDDQAVLIKYDFDLNRFKKTTSEIENNIRLRPFELKQPLLRWMSFRLLSILAVLLSIYVILVIA